MNSCLPLVFVDMISPTQEKAKNYVPCPRSRHLNELRGKNFLIWILCLQAGKPILATLRKKGIYLKGYRVDDKKIKDLPCSSDGKESAYKAGHLGSIPGSGRSSGEGNGNSLQYSCLKNPMDRGGL